MNKYKQEKNIIITGSAGFLGSNLIEKLKVDTRYFIYALSSKGTALQLKNTYTNVCYGQKDIFFDYKEREKIKDSIVVNCAFPRNLTGESLAEGLKYTQHIFEISKEYGAQAIINISSQSVYSASRKSSATEEEPVCLENGYAVGKYAVELMLESICKGTEIAYTNLRMASLIGPGFDQRIINRVVLQALQGEKIHIIKSDQRFGFLDIEDAVNAVIALINLDYSKWRNIYNVGNSKGYTIDELISCIARIFKEEDLSFPEVCEDKGDASGCSMVDYHLLYKDTGFRPTIELEESIRKIVRQANKHS